MFLTWKIVSYISRGTWAMSSFSFDYCFLAEVTASNLKADKLVSQFSYVNHILLVNFHTYKPYYVFAVSS